MHVKAERDTIERERLTNFSESLVLTGAPVDAPLLIRQRLDELSLDQKDLARAVQVTESYISQLLTRKKAPPAPSRTDLYEKIGDFLGLPSGELATLASAQRQEELKRKVTEPPTPLFQEFRALILDKCAPRCRAEVRRVFEKEPFGDLERLVTRTILDSAQGVANEELRNEEWLRSMADASSRSYEQVRVAVLEFLDTDTLHISAEDCVTFLAPMIESWEIDLKTFAVEVTLSRRLAPRRRRRFEFVETQVEQSEAAEPGLARFLEDPAMSGDATDEELELLRGLRFPGRSPSPLYYYRELQSLRDPLHFPASAQPAKRSSRRNASRPPKP